MDAKKGPTLRAQWLGKQLRELREGQKLTLKEAGEYIQRDQSSLSRMEQGVTPMRVPDVLALLNLYGVDDTKIRDGLERLSRDIWQKGWWDGYAEAFTGRIIDHAWIESRTNKLCSFDAMVIHGLLQTPSYARSVMTAADPAQPPTRIELWLEFRMKRQQILEEEDPPEIGVIIDEGVLRRVVGGPEVMREQLAHLGELAQRTNISIQVLPFSAGAHASPEGPFEIFDMPEPYPNVAYVVSRAGSIYVEAEGVERFDRAYDALQMIALPPDESLSVIADIARQTS